ncbi:MAG: hypothetical protein ABFR53_01105 [Actinomycetota bacterium]
MGIGSIFNVLRAKWWIVLVVAVLGAFIGTYLATSHNDSIRTRWRGEAPVTFIDLSDTDSNEGSGSKGGNSTSSDISAQAEGVRAQLLLEETLNENPKLSIDVDREENILLFIALGRDGDETLAQALELRSQYQSLSSDVLNIDQIEESIDSLLTDIETLQTAIDAVTVEEPPLEDPQITSTRSVLVEEIAKLNERQTQLRIWVLSPEARPTEDDFFGIVEEETKPSDPTETTETTIAPEPIIVSTEDLEEELEVNARVLDRLNVQLVGIPDPPEAEELDKATALSLEAMQAQADELQTQYIELLQVADGRSPGGFFEEPTAIDVTPAARPVGLFALAGALAGALVSASVLIGLDSARKTVWAAASLEKIACLGEIDRNRSDGLPQDVWYPNSVSRRRRDIQAFRATIDAITQERPSVIGFFGVKTAGDEVGALAADLATAYAVASRDVLLIDANAYEPNALAEYGVQSSSLTRILVRNQPVTEAATAIDELIDATPRVMPRLTSLHIDAATHDPIDAVASPNSRSLMDIARERFDIVIVAGPAISDPLSDTVARRIDFAVLAGTAGRTTMPQLATATGILTERHTTAPGVVILKGKRESLVSKLADRFRSAWRSLGTKVERWRSNDSDEQAQDIDTSRPEISASDVNDPGRPVEQATKTGSNIDP